MIAKNSVFCYSIRMEQDKEITPEVVEAAKDIIAEAEEEGLIEDGRTAKHYHNRPRSRHSCLKFFGCLIIMVAAILACTVFLTVYITRPIVKTVEELPADFPKDLIIYQLNQAQIKVLSPESQQKIQQLSAALPDWLVQMLTNYLYPDLKTQIIAENKTPENLPANPTIKDLPASDSKKPTQIVTLTWSDINKTKEDLYDYYKKNLEQKGFSVKELASTNEIDLSFFKNGISGAMTIMDSFAKDGNSVVKMTVDYLNKN